MHGDHGEGLRHRLDRDEVADGEQHRGDGHAELAPDALRDDRDEDRRAVLHSHHRQVDRVQVARQVLLDLLEKLDVAAALLAQIDEPHLGDARDRRFGHGEHGAEDDAESDRGDPDHPANG